MYELHFPHGLTAEKFLARHWQKKPLLFRQALPGFPCGLEPEELAGMACEAGIESRLVLEKHGSTPWEARHGPFDEASFRRLPESHWTLLVQDVDKHWPEAARLLDYFRFIPDWRLDDLMVSYAVDQGSVGPHTDDYDVFLYQAKGRRRWKIHYQQVDEEAYIPGLELRILPDFEAEEEWLLEPGDMLYLPPNVAHWGVAEGECMTCSVGFRAPSLREMAAAWFEQTVEHHLPPTRYRDPPLRPQAAPGEIRADALSAFKELLQRTGGLGVSSPSRKSISRCRLATVPSLRNASSTASGRSPLSTDTDSLAWPSAARMGTATTPSTPTARPILCPASPETFCQSSPTTASYTSAICRSGWSSRPTWSFSVGSTTTAI
ncbi:MAG: cupin domain-containing protein [Candidatus Thiodiazotropha sp.]